MKLRMLVAIDESEVSGRVTEFVSRFFAGSDVEVLALNVARVPLPLYPGVSYGMVSPYIWAGVYPESLSGSPDQLADEGVARGKRIIEASGIAEDDAIVEIGDPVETIMKVAREQDVDLVVIGATKKSWWDRLLQGSVSSDLVHEGTRPILLVR